MATLCDPVDCSLPSSSVHGILQARILEWVAISFSRGSPDPGIEARSPTLQADALTSAPPGKPLKYKNTVSQKTSYRDTELLCSVPFIKKGMVGTRIYGILAKRPKSTRLNSD